MGVEKAILWLNKEVVKLASNMNFVIKLKDLCTWEIIICTKMVNKTVSLVKLQTEFAVSHFQDFVHQLEFIANIPNRPKHKLDYSLESWLISRNCLLEWGWCWASMVLVQGEKTVWKINFTQIILQTVIFPLCWIRLQNCLQILIILCRSRKINALHLPSTSISLLISLF